MNLTLNFTLANTNISNEILADFIIEEDFPAIIYKLTPSEGKVISAATDWMALIQSVEHGLTFLNSLWNFYSKFIKPKKIDDSTSGIYISIQINNNVNNIWIGNEINSKEELITKFNEILKSEDLDSIQTNEAVDAAIWKRIK